MMHPREKHTAIIFYSYGSSSQKNYCPAFLICYLAGKKNNLGGRKAEVRF
jgi:hypothetical protein